ncbi:MAG: hypothetical protein ACREBF_00005 [Candidatus Micrarchaeales archaeon]
MSELLKLPGVNPNETILNALFASNLKSHLVYIYAYYFLLSMGRDISIDSLNAVLKAIGVPEDKERAAEAIAFLNKQLGMEHGL